MLIAVSGRCARAYIYAHRAQRVKQVSDPSLPGFNGVQCLEHFCSKGRTSLHCQKVGEIPGYG